MHRKTGFSTGVVIVTAVVLAGALNITTFDLFHVDGRSMEPTLEPGQVLVVNRLAYGFQLPLTNGYLFRWASPSPGEIIVFKSPIEDRVVVKRCSGIGARGAVFALGDNGADSFDSRDYGFVPVDDVRGKVIF
jgi:signal peptidase I